ncbi:flavin reductase (NADPH) [Episyrphus balteatus]|uniref:flavin reductase (NADPH) n=1 Tax=Episyrphus balteatus TaxID=286459 RepID=UPI002485A65C|nr:flavin reductase (NADPH) [Episyrphus balteatus]
MSKIAIIGGTGMTGKCVVEYALQKGLNIRLMYRTEETVPESFKGKVELVKGDATNLEDVKNVLQGVDAVCVTLGTRNKLEASTEMSTGTKNIIEAMKELNIRRFSIIMSSFLFMNPEQVPKMFHNINDDHRKMLDMTKSSGLDFIAILPPHIADEPSTDVTILHDASPGRAVSKYDLAKFIVDSLDQPEHYGKVCGIAKKAPA